MNFEILGLFLDFAVLVCLGATIFFALRLSKSLSNFKAYREEFTDLVRVLSQNIDQAQRAVMVLKESSHDTADELSGLIKKSKAMIAELQLINEAGDNLASRIEGLATRSAGKVPTASHDWFGEEDEEEDLEEFMHEEVDSFAIRDNDYEEDEPPASTGGKNFQSQAERELFEALMGNKKSGKI